MRANLLRNLFDRATIRKYGSIPDDHLATVKEFPSALHVIIAGCGRVGSELASTLQQMDHSVAVVDRDPAAFERLKPSFSGTKITGFVFDRETLEEAQIDKADAFASVTSGDNSNILSARVAKEHYRVKHVVARIYDPRRAQIYQRLGIQTVATVRWTTDQMMRFLVPEDAAVEYTVDNGEVVIIGLQAEPDVVGKHVNEFDLDSIRRVVAVSRFGVPRVPDKDLTVQEGDILYFSVARGESATLAENLKKVGRPE